MWLIFGDKMDAGQLVTMQVFSFFVFGPLQEIGNIIIAYREAEASLNNYDRLMSKEPEYVAPAPKHIGSIESLVFEQVSFQHQSASQNAIHNINFSTQKYVYIQKDIHHERTATQ